MARSATTALTTPGQLVAAGLAEPQRLEALERVAALGYDPDLNDGVVLNIAPFHEVTPWKEARAYWDELCAGRYEWSTMSQRLKEKGVFGHR